MYLIFDVVTILLMTGQMIESMKKSGEDVPGAVLNMLKRPELLESKDLCQATGRSFVQLLAMTSGDYFIFEDMFTNDKAKKNKGAESDHL
jgi:hypothetical protein